MPQNGNNSVVQGFWIIKLAMSSDLQQNRSARAGIHVIIQKADGVSPPAFRNIQYYEGGFYGFSSAAFSPEDIFAFTCAGKFSLSSTASNRATMVSRYACFALSSAVPVLSPS